MTPLAPSLDLAPIGNCSVSALVDRQGRFVWACAPRVDGDPVFSALMDGTDPEHGFWAVEVEGMAHVHQEYVRNTAVLRTVLTTLDGAAVEVLDFARAISSTGAPTGRSPSAASCGRCTARRG